MRIISGAYGGRRFETPHNLNARPTTDLAKESLFNILQNRIDFEDCSVLDLFSGTGSISFEFISRGANRVVCVEMGKVQQQFIQKVAGELKISRELQLVRGDVFRYLNGVTSQFDVVFADPPYALPELPTLPNLIMNGNVLKEDGVFILEHGKENDFSAHPFFVETRQYGAVHFSFFAHNQENTEN